MLDHRARSPAQQVASQKSPRVHAGALASRTVDCYVTRQGSLAIGNILVFLRVIPTRFARRLSRPVFPLSRECAVKGHVGPRMQTRIAFPPNENRRGIRLGSQILIIDPLFQTQIALRFYLAVYGLRIFAIYEKVYIWNCQVSSILLSKKN